MTQQGILVAGIGNIFLGDDAFGIEVAQRLAHHTLPEGVRVADFGIRGFDLAYTLTEEHHLAILVDALPRGGQLGTLYVIRPDLDDPDAAPEKTLDTHGMGPAKALRLVRALGGDPGEILVVGCEPAMVEAREDGQMGLSGPVQAAVPEAVALVESLITKALSETASRCSRRQDYEAKLVYLADSCDSANRLRENDCWIHARTKALPQDDGDVKPSKD
jgi:hydrogenase maturation protease